MNKFCTLSLACMATLFASGAQALSTDDFVKNASIGNEFEIESSKIALKRSANDDVKQFAQTMIDDHTKVGNDMQAALKSSGANAPQATTALDSKHQKMIDKLQSASDSNFDKLYIKNQKKAHKEAVKLFSKYAKKGDDASLKNFANQELPTLKEHKQHVDELKS